MNLKDTRDAVGVGRRLGHDLHRLGCIALQPDWPHAVREAAVAGQSTGATRHRGS